MNQNNLSVLFFLKKEKTNKQGICPIYCRITYLKMRKQFSTGESIDPSDWNAKKQKAIYKSIENEQLKLQLQIIAANIKKEYLKLQLKENEFTVEDIFQHYLGKPAQLETYLIAYFNEFLKKKKRLIGIDIKLVTWKKYNYVCSQAKEFIIWKYRKKDVPLNKIKLQFLHEFEYYLKTERKQKQVTINKAIQ